LLTWGELGDARDCLRFFDLTHQPGKFRGLPQGLKIRIFFDLLAIRKALLNCPAQLRERILVVFVQCVHARQHVMNLGALRSALRSNNQIQLGRCVVVPPPGFRGLLVGRDEHSTHKAVNGNSFLVVLPLLGGLEAVGDRRYSRTRKDLWRCV